MASVEKRPSTTGKGAAWRVRWRLGGTRTGKWQTATFDREREARAFKARVEACGHQWPEDAADSAANSIPVDGLTVDDLALRYLAWKETRVKSDRTVADYRRDYTNWIKPTFGHQLVHDVTELEVQEWVDAVPRAAKTVCGYHALLSGMFKWGARPSRQLVANNPCVGTELPVRRKGAVRGMLPGDFEILHRAACAVDPDAADFLAFMVGSGWRWSEITALQVANVRLDVKQPYAEVNTVRRRNAANAVVQVDDTKTDTSRRRVRLTPQMTAMLRRRIVGKSPGDHVFTTVTGLPLHYSNFRRDALGPILDQAEREGLSKRPTMHELRHSMAALLIESGVPLPAIQRRLGHASISTTVDVYGRMVQDVDDAALDALDNAFFTPGRLRVVSGGGQG